MRWCPGHGRMRARRLAQAGRRRGGCGRGRGCPSRRRRRGRLSPLRTPVTMGVSRCRGLGGVVHPEVLCRAESEKAGAVDFIKFKIAGNFGQLVEGRGERRENRQRNRAVGAEGRQQNGRENAEVRQRKGRANAEGRQRKGRENAAERQTAPPRSQPTAPRTPQPARHRR